MNTNGYFAWNGVGLFAGKPLISQLLGVREVDEDEWELPYGSPILGYLVLRRGDRAGSVLVVPLSVSDWGEPGERARSRRCTIDRPRRLSPRCSDFVFGARILQ